VLLVDLGMLDLSGWGVDLNTNFPRQSWSILCNPKLALMQILGLLENENGFAS
jgi:hypothetical protein